MLKNLIFQGSIPHFWVPISARWNIRPYCWDLLNNFSWWISQWENRRDLPYGWWYLRYMPKRASKFKLIKPQKSFGWWFQPTPLKNMSESQLGWLFFPIWWESHNSFMFQTTSQSSVLFPFHLRTSFFLAPMMLPIWFSRRLGRFVFKFSGLWFIVHTSPMQIIGFHQLHPHCITENLIQSPFSIKTTFVCGLLGCASQFKKCLIIIISYSP
jgi:hypothetical protein